MNKFLSLIVISGVMIFTSFSQGQVRRIVLMEVATNSGCGNCAVSNEIMNTFYKDNFGGVISLRYHAAWPDISDPMYADNPIDNDARTNYYGVTYTPQYFMDGVSKGSADDVERMIEEMKAELAENSPFWIDIYSNISPDSVKFTVSVKAFQNVSLAGLKLRTAIIERLKHFDTPPGSNGETDFPDVMRKLLPDYTGITLPALASGDSAAFSFAYPVADSWNWKDLAVVSWIQNDSTKKVLQSNIDIPTVIITPLQSDFLEVNNNEAYSESYLIKNDNNKRIDISVTSESNQIPNGWTHDFQTISFVVPPHDSLLFTDGFSTDTTNSIISLRYRVTNNADYLHYGYLNPFLAANRNQDVVIINENQDASVGTELFPFLDSLSLDYSSVGSFDTRHWKNRLEELNIASAVLFSGNSYPPYRRTDILFLINLQNSGVPILVTGQKISYSRSDFSEAVDFYDNYLDALFVSPDSSSIIFAEPNNSITNIGELSLGGFFTPVLENIESRSGNSFPLFSSDTIANKTVALANETNGFKNIYLGFGIEQVQNTELRKTLLNDIFRWFGLLNPDGITEITGNPTSFLLEQNYPNPVIKNRSENAITTIDYYIGNPLPNKARKVSLKVFDLLGREIATLVNKSQTPGRYSVKFNTAELPSGIYFYQLKTGHYSATKKMLLSK